MTKHDNIWCILSLTLIETSKIKRHPSSQQELKGSHEISQWLTCLILGQYYA